jgi:hypothetical protein
VIPELLYPLITLGIKAALARLKVRIPVIDPDPEPAGGKADVELSSMVEWLAKAKSGAVKVDDKDRELLTVIRDQLNALTASPSVPLTLPAK